MPIRKWWTIRFIGLDARSRKICVQQAEFDAVVSEYESQHAASIRLSGEGPEYFSRYKAKAAAAALAKRGVNPARIMDFGAGIGNALPHLQCAFPQAEILCLDVSQASLAQCADRAVRPVETLSYDGKTIPCRDGSFDFIFTACVFHHIPEEEHVRLLKEIRRVMAPGGRFMLFEHNPWNPLTRHAVRNCPFDENAVLISAPQMRQRMKAAGFVKTKLTWTIFFPGRLSSLRPLERGLSWVPLGAQYSLLAR